MVGQATKPYRATLAGSIGAGMGSVFNPGGRKYYVLEHRVSSKYHRAGEAQEIIVDQIELGRDSRCQVRFDDSFTTVSRRHAAIVKDGDNWKLVQISKTNTTLLNGRPVKTEWYLQNGDEIQLSVNGPKLRFIVPTGKKATVGSIGLTRRLSLFRQQALRPYKQAIAALATVLVIAVGIGGTVIFMQNEKIKDNTKELAKANEDNLKNTKLIAEQKRLLNNQGGIIDSLSKLKPRTIVRTRTIIHDGGNDKGTQGIDMSPLHPHVYHITAKPYIDGKPITIGDEAYEWTGTGFQLQEGKFVTARHVTTPYYSNNFYIRDGQVIMRGDASPVVVYYELLLNILMQQGKLDIKYECVSPGGSFTLTNSGIQEFGQSDHVYRLEQPFQVIHPSTKEVLAEIPSGANIRMGALGAMDFAYFNHAGGGVKANRDLSRQLKQGTKLYILGYPHGWAKGSKPIYSEAICSQDGLSKELGGTIMVSNNNTEGGNSGGPIFVKSENGWEVVAIVSGSNYAKGRFVPISMIP